jgi:hypothetical protein
MREVLSKTLTIKAVGDVRAIADTPISNSGDDGAQKRRVVLGGKIVVDMRRPPSLVCWKAQFRQSTGACYAASEISFNW